MNWSRGYPGMPPAGYIRLSAEGEITACFTGTWAYRSATSRYSSARRRYRNGPPVSRGIRRVCPAEKGIRKPSGAVLGSPCTLYVQKLWYFLCSPSVITGEPVASNSAMVSRIASS